MKSLHTLLYIYIAAFCFASCGNSKKTVAEAVAVGPEFSADRKLLLKDMTAHRSNAVISLPVSVPATKIAFSSVRIGTVVLGQIMIRIVPTGANR